MEYKVNCKQTTEKHYPSGFEGEVLVLFGVSSDDDPKNIFYCDVAYIVASIKAGNVYKVEKHNYSSDLRINHTHKGYEFVETVKDETRLDNLMSLPSCPLDLRIKKQECPPPDKSVPCPSCPPPFPLWKKILLFSGGLLLPILYCLFFGNCGKPSTDCKNCPKDTVYIKIPSRCPMYDPIIQNSDVHFDIDKWKLEDLEKMNPITKDNGIDTLKNLANLLTKSPEMYATLMGFTDNTGSEHHNDTLSVNREKTVRKYFTDNGVKASQIIFERGYGFKFPEQSNDTPTGKAHNRRVEIRIFGLRTK